MKNNLFCKYSITNDSVSFTEPYIFFYYEKPINEAPRCKSLMKPMLVRVFKDLIMDSPLPSAILIGNSNLIRQSPWTSILSYNQPPLRGLNPTVSVGKFLNTYLDNAILATQLKKSIGGSVVKVR